MKYLVDANVLSEATKPTPDPRVIAWLREHEPDIAVDPVILGELRFGILSALGRGHGHEMGGTAGASSHNRESHADQG